MIPNLLYHCRQIFMVQILPRGPLHETYHETNAGMCFIAQGPAFKKQSKTLRLLKNDWPLNL